MSSNVISLQDYKQKKYMKMTRQNLFQLPKHELLQQLIDYYEAVKKDPFSLAIAMWGEDLMDAISARALTKELHDLAENHKEKGPAAVFKMD